MLPMPGVASMLPLYLPPAAGVSEFLSGGSFSSGVNVLLGCFFVICTTWVGRVTHNISASNASPLSEIHNDSGEDLSHEICRFT